MKRNKPPLASFRVFDVDDGESLRQWKSRYSGPEYTHRTGIRRLKFDGAILEVVVGVARRRSNVFA